MPNPSGRSSAQIIPFRTGSQALRARRVTPDVHSSAPAAQARLVPTVACGSGWYHEAALREAAHEPSA